MSIMRKKKEKAKGTKSITAMAPLSTFIYNQKSAQSCSSFPQRPEEGKNERTNSNQFPVIGLKKY